MHIYPNSRLECITSHNGRKYDPQIIIEDNVNIEQNFHCTCANKVTIGEGTLITQNVGIFDINHIYSNIHQRIQDQDFDIKDVSIGKNCFIGMNTVILPGSKIGDHSIVGASSVISGEIPSYTVVVGNPYKIIKKYDFDLKKWVKYGK